MVTFTHAPVNAYTWTIGAIAVYAFTIKSIATFRRTKNPVAKIYSWLGFWFGTGILFYGAPLFFTQDPAILKHTYFLADICVQISMQFGVWLSWFIGFRRYMKYPYILAFTIPLSLISMTFEILHSMAYVSAVPHLIQYTDPTVVLILKSILYVIVAGPMSYFLLKQVPNQTSIRAKFQSLVSGLIPLFVAGAATSNNIFDKGSDTVQSTTYLAIFFIIFFLAQLPKPKLIR